MIEIIKRNDDYSEIECQHCHSVLRYTKDDVTFLYKESGFTCPSCNEFVLVNSARPFKYPESFEVCDATNAEAQSNQEIQELIDDVVKNLKDVSFFYEGKGDTMVFGYRDDIGTSIYVTRNFYESYD